MSNTPFNIQALNFEKDMNASVSVASHKIEIPAHTFVEHCEKRELRSLLRGRKKRIEITIPADFYLDITTAPKKATGDKNQLLIPLAIVGGVALGILAFAPFLIKINFAWAITAFLTLIIGMQLGWKSHQRAKERQEELFNRLENLLNKFRNSTSVE